MEEYNNFFIQKNSDLSDAINQLEQNSIYKILFVVDHENKIYGSITDGDLRRALIKKNIDLQSSVCLAMNKRVKIIFDKNISLKQIIEFRKNQYKIIPIVDHEYKIIDILDFSTQKTILPLDAIIMAGGKGKRLIPLTLSKPKPLLEINNKTLIEYSIDNLTKYGTKNVWISLGYLGSQIKNYLNSLKFKNVKLDYVSEKKALGTIGAISKVKQFKNKNVLITNADLITDLDLEKFYFHHIKEKSDLTILVRKYDIKIPFGVLQIKGKKVKKILEKPIISQWINGGIYIMKTEHINLVPLNTFFNMTDLIEKLIKSNLRVSFYEHNSVWYDLGDIEDFKKTMKSNDIAT